MKTLTKLPNAKSKVRYLGGYDNPNCQLEVGKIYEINSVKMHPSGNYSNSTIECASITMNETDTYESYWYIKGEGNGYTDFDKFELVEEYLTREDLLVLVDEYKTALKSILENSEDMLDSYVEESGVIDIRNIAKTALEKWILIKDLHYWLQLFLFHVVMQSQSIKEEAKMTKALKIEAVYDGIYASKSSDLLWITSALLCTT